MDAQSDSEFAFDVTADDERDEGKVEFAESANSLESLNHTRIINVLE